MSWAKTILAVFVGLCGIAAVYIAVNVVNSESQVKENCIENYRQCHNSIKPCCRQRQLEDPCDMPEDFICNYFDGEICEPLSKIRKLDEYIKLKKNLKSTDISERTILYREILGLSTMDSIMLYAIYIFGACLIILLVVVMVYSMNKML